MSVSSKLPSFKNENGSLIMGIVRSLEYEHLSPFLSTLHATGYSGGLAFFCDDISSSTRSAFSSMGIYLRDFREVRISIPFLNKKVNAYRIFSPVQKMWFYVASEEAKRQFASNAFHIHQSRHFLYTEFLENNHSYSRIMLSDTRDVVFQRDPFDFAINDSLCCFLEDPSITIENEVHNAGWIRRGFGQDILDAIGKNPISCAGITMGSVDAVLEYTRRMCSILLTPRIRSIAGITGLDQGIHNYAIRMKDFGDRLHLFENMKGPVMTMGLMKQELRNIDPESGLLLNSDGSLCNTIHQYDRHPDLLHNLPNRIIQAHSIGL
ncbi:MAG: hypothetical protein ACK5F4_02595 [Ignavibacteria bacterium]|jgi:hypothetical protein